MNGDDPGRGRWEEEQARASEDEARASASAAAESEAAEESRCFIPGDRVLWTEQTGQLGTITKISGSGYHRVEWDDHSDATFFSTAKAFSVLRLAKGDDALPRHIWIFDVPERTSSGWDGPLPTLDEPVCAVCREKQTDENEYGPCRKAKA